MLYPISVFGYVSQPSISWWSSIVMVWYFNMYIGESAAELSDDPDSEPTSSSADAQPPPPKRQKTHRIGEILCVVISILVSVIEKLI